MPGAVGGLELLTVTSLEVRVLWQPLTCTERHGAFVGYAYELVRLTTQDGQPITIAYDVNNSTSLSFSTLIPFTNYSVLVRFVNHNYHGPKSRLDFTTLEDGIMCCTLLCLCCEQLH